MFGSDNEKDTYLPETQSRDRGTPGILIMTADKTEDLEFFYPYYRFIEAGFHVDVATPDGGAFKGKQGLGLKNSLKIEDVSAADYALLYIPGGKAPAVLKDNEAAITVVKAFVSSEKPVAAICHGPQLLAAANVIRGRRIAAWPEVQKEVEEAGATYVNAETVNDGLFTTARWPGDLPAYMKVVLQLLKVPTTKSGGSYSSAA